MEALWDRLGIGPALKKVIQQHVYTVDYERALFAMTANRLCEPESKLGVWDRWLRQVYLPSCTNCIRLNRKAFQEAARYDGKWVLITNDDTITLEDAASGYKGLLIIERCFRTLKSSLDIRPVYH
jgi:hypothetical protein